MSVLTLAEEYSSESLVGVPMRREWAGEAHDPQRDAFSAETRLDAYDRLEAQYEENREAHQRRGYQHAVFMLSGDVGCGETAIAMGAKARAAGMTVYSTASYLFGRRINAVNAFRFAEDLDDKSFVFIDETHSLADRYAEMSVRNRSLSNSFALIRKKGIIVVMASVHEGRVAPSMKSTIDSLIYPRTYRPGRRMRFPPWCYVRCSIIAPQPFRSGRLGDEYDVPRQIAKPHRREMRPPPPLVIYEAAKLMDSWEKPNIPAGIQTTAAKIKNEQQEEGTPQEQQQMEQQQKKIMGFFGGVAKALNSGYKFPETTNLEWKLVVNVARQFGWVGEDKEALDIIKTVLGLNSQYKVNREAMPRQFRPRSADDSPEA